MARQTQEQALALSRELQDRTIEVEVLNSLGFINANLGQGRIAIDYYQQSLQVAREIGDRNVEASVLGNLAVRYDNIGEPAQSISYYQTAIALAHQLGKKETEAITLRNLGRLQLRQGELQQALDLAQQSLALARVGGNPRTVGGALDLLGRTHALLGEYTPAQEYLKQAQAVYEAAEEYRDIAFCLRERSSICMQIGETNQALDLLQQALAIHRRIKQTEAIVADLIDLGALYLKRTELQQSLATLSEALALSRSIGVVQEEARCLLHLSRTHQAMGASEQAKNILQMLLPLAQRMKSRLLEAEVQYDLALLSLKQQHYDESQSAIELALSIIENSRTGLVNPETRANFRSDNQRYYEIYTDVLAQRAIRQNNSAIAAQALESVERARARSLLDLLTERRIDIRQGVDGELLKREQELQRRLSAKEELLQQFSTKKSDEEQSKSLQAEITTLTVDLQLIESRIRVASPTYAALTQPQPLKLSEIQQHVLDRETVLLEYALGAECSYLFVITSTSLKIAILPKRAEIETAVRKYYELFEKQRSLSIFTDLAKRQKALTQLEREHHDVARTLSKILLQPAAETLQQKRLMIVADGALHYVSFAALPEPRASDFLAETPKRTGTPLAQRPKTKDQPLIAAHEILTLPSASTLAIVRQQLGTRAPAPKMLALFADPVFSHDDQRITVQTRGVNRNTSEQKFTRLLKTRQEAEAIMALVPKTDRLVALDFDANRTLALSEQLNQYRYLHFATHGIWNEKTPALSGLLLSQVDQNGNTQNGFLTIKDVFNHKLASDLVVLSACQTAMGKELQGEGMMGLTRGFMYAGARRVVASLWQVNDAATTKLMQQFYQGMLGEKHLTPAAALRAAQIAMWQDKRWNAPQYWAAFILQGEW